MQKSGEKSGRKLEIWRLPALDDLSDYTTEASFENHSLTMTRTQPLRSP